MTETSSEMRYRAPIHGPELAARVPFGLRPVQNRHRAVELPYDGSDDGRRSLPRRVAGDDWPRPAGVKVDRLGASLHGSLAYTGVGHGTDRAVILGLTGETPITVDPDKADAQVEKVKAEKRVSPPGHPAYNFDPAVDLVLDKKTPLLGHANGMAFYAYDAAGRLLLKRIYYSIGGGFVVSEEELQRMKTRGSVTTEGKRVPYPFKNAVEMLRMADKSGLSIAEMKRINEEAAHVTRGARPGARPYLGCDEGLHRSRTVAGRHHAGRP